MPSLRWTAVAGTALVTTALAPAAIAATPNSTPDATYVANGPVNAVVRTPSTIYIGGDFDQIGPATGPWAMVSATSAQVDTSWPRVTGGVGVSTEIPDGSGGFYIGGNFTHVGGVARNNIAHILADKTVDPNWNPNVTRSSSSIPAIVTALARSGSTIYFGGEFTTVNGSTTRNDAAAVDASTGAVTGWDPNPNDRVQSLAVDGSTVYLGGNFSTVNGSVMRSSVAAVDATTGVAATTWNPGADGRVNGIAVSGGIVYLAGAFTTVAGQTRHHAAAVAATDGSLTSWNPNLNNDAFTLTVSGSTVYVGGSFDTVNGSTSRHGLVAVDEAGGTALPWTPTLPAGGEVLALAVSGSTVYAADAPSSGGTLRSSVTALDASTGDATSWDPSPNDSVTTIAISGSAVALGGIFTSLGGVSRNRLAALSTTDGTVTSWNPDVTGGSGVSALALAGQTLYVGGIFNDVGGQSLPNAAAVDATTGTPTSWNPNVNGGVDALAVSGQTVYLGGTFTTVNGSTPRNRAAAVDASTGTVANWDPNLNNEVDALAVSGQTVYLGGTFTTVNGSTTRNRAAAVDATTGIAKGWDPNVSGLGSPSVAALAVAGQTVYLGGSFSSINGSTARSAAAAVDAGTGVATDWDPQLGSNGGALKVSALAVDGSTVYLGGTFDTVNMSTTRTDAAGVDATSAVATAWDPHLQRFESEIKAIAPDGDGGLVLGGSFFGTDTSPHAMVAQFSLAPSQAAPSITGTAATGETLTCTATDLRGSRPLTTSLRWLRDGTAIDGATSTGYTVTSADAGHALTCEVTATNLGGTARAGSAAVSIPSTQTPPPPAAPVITHAALTPKSFTAKKGSTLKLTLSESATIKAAVTETIHGRKVHRRCKAGARRGKRCTLTVRRGSLRFAGSAGANAFPFKVSRKIRPGRYTATLVATDSGGRASTPVKLTFTILKPKRRG